MLGPGLGRSLSSLVLHGRPAVVPEAFHRLSPARDLYGAAHVSLR
jgi:hypothetical protein